MTIKEGNFEAETFIIVGAAEANPREGKISNESPIGKSILGHKMGETVKVETPAVPTTLRSSKSAKKQDARRFAPRALFALEAGFFFDPYILSSFVFYG